VPLSILWTRRSVYGYIDRGLLPEMLVHFDFSDPSQPNSRRPSTLVPQQALFLMNSPMVAEVSRGVLRRKEVVSSVSNQNKIFNLYRILFQRDPSPMEIRQGLDFVGFEIRSEPETREAMKEIGAKALEQLRWLQQRAAKEEKTKSDFSAIRNPGQWVKREALGPWEAYVQALLLSNEVAYVH
jgi:hypothetical protein